MLDQNKEQIENYCKHHEELVNNHAKDVDNRVTKTENHCKMFGTKSKSINIVDQINTDHQQKNRKRKKEN